MQILCESNTGNPAEPVGIIFGGIKAMEFDDLIGLNTLGLRKRKLLLARMMKTRAMKAANLNIDLNKAV